MCRERIHKSTSRQHWMNNLRVSTSRTKTADTIQRKTLKSHN